MRDKQNKAEVVGQIDLQLQTQLDQLLDQGVVRRANLIDPSREGNEPVDLSFLPNDKKITVRTRSDDAEVRLWYRKTDAHDGPDAIAFDVASGLLNPDYTYNASKLFISKQGVLTAYVDLNSFFYADQRVLRDLEFKVEDKTLDETLSKVLKQIDGLGSYHYFVDQAMQFQTGVNRIREIVEALPVIGLELPIRYMIDIRHLQARLYELEESGQIKLLSVVGGFEGQSSHQGFFLGNRIEIIDNNMYVVDEETHLAITAIDSDDFMKTYLHLTATDISDKNQNRFIKQVNSQLKRSYL
jgi:hypothetical protein